MLLTNKKYSFIHKTSNISFNPLKNLLVSVFLNFPLSFTDACTHTCTYFILSLILTSLSHPGLFFLIHTLRRLKWHSFSSVFVHAIPKSSHRPFSSCLPYLSTLYHFRLFHQYIKPSFPFLNASATSHWFFSHFIQIHTCYIHVLSWDKWKHSPLIANIFPNLLLVTSVV